MEPSGQNSYVNYGVCASKKACAEWKSVIEALLKKHKDLNPLLFQYESDPKEILPEFRKLRPKYACFVALPKELTMDYYLSWHEFTRTIDENTIYLDTIPGIITGPTKETALRIALHETPLKVRSVLSNTWLNFAPFTNGCTFSEITKNLVYTKEDSGEIVESHKGPDDIVKGLVERINSNKIDLVVTSAHADETDLRPAFGYKGGWITFFGGTNDLLGIDIAFQRHKVESDNPKIYLGCGNCLIGKVKTPSCMVFSWMNSNAFQYMGYIVETWFGFAGWGVNKYFIETPGKFSFAESFFANLQILNYYKSLHDCMLRDNKGILKGLNYDQNSVAFYGDPAWDARIEGPNLKELQPYEMTVDEVKPRQWIVRVVCQKDCCWECPDADDKDTIPGRPPLFIFKERFRRKLKVVKGDLELTELFVMVRLEGFSMKGSVFEGGFLELEELI